MSFQGSELLKIKFKLFNNFADSTFSYPLLKGRESQACRAHKKFFKVL